ncbi:MAG: transcriptional regulator NrdR [Planctomycetaceae bacterium]
MQCPFCHQGESKVIDSRQTQDAVIRRRRECLECDRRFTTYERIETPLKVIKKNGSREPYDSTKIRKGIELAVYKRSVSPERIDQLIADVERAVNDEFELEVPSRYIGEKIFEALRLIDQVAFVRFASVYREFQDVNDFVEELQPMLQQRPK